MLTDKELESTITGKRFLPLVTKKPTVDNMLDWILKVKDRKKKGEIPASWYYQEVEASELILKQLLDPYDPYAQTT